MQLIEDFNFDDNFTILTESDRGEKVFRIRGVFSRCNFANRNKRVYHRDVMEEALNDVSPLLKNGGFVGELDHPPSPKINMEKISHKITELAITDDNAVIGEMIPAGPKKGDLISILEDRIRIGVSTRGTGGLSPYRGPLGEGLLEVQKGFRLRAIDIVHDPSAGTYPDIVTEATENFMFDVPNNFKAVWDDVFGKK